MGVGSIPPRDSSGRGINRFAATESGWSYHLQAVQFESCNLSSLYNADYLGVDLGFASISVYKDDGGGGLTLVADQADADLNGIVTFVDWEPTFDYEIIGGQVRQSVIPVSDVRLWVIGVPDIPAQFGGSKEFICCVNMKHVQLTDSITADGRASKRLNYDAVNHTNKMRVILRHPAGFKHKGSVFYEVYRA